MHASYIVLNEELLLPYSLKSIYDYVEEISIVEGAVANSSHVATEDGHSIDNTLRVIKNFPDPNGKIKLITKDGFWKDKSEMLDAIVSHIKDEWFFRIDADEIFKQHDIQKLYEWSQDHKEIFVAYCNFIHFWKNLSTVITGEIWNKPPHATLFRMDNGLKHVGNHHCFPVDNHNRSLRSHKFYNNKRRVLPITIYHYSYIKDAENIKAKLIFFARRDKRLPLEKAEKTVESHGWFTNRLNPLHRLKIFKGTHPEVMKDFT